MDPQKPDITPLWMALVLDKAKQQVIVAAFDVEREKAEASARDREAPDAPMVCVNVTGGAEAFASRISLWLADNDIVGAENSKIVREIASGLKKTIDKIDRRHRKRRDRKRRRPGR